MAALVTLFICPSPLFCHAKLKPVKEERDSPEIKDLPGQVPQFADPKGSPSFPGPGGGPHWVRRMLGAGVWAQSFSCVRLFATLWTSSPGSSVHGILQARMLEWVAIPYSRGSSRPRDHWQVCSLPLHHLPGRKLLGVGGIYNSKGASSQQGTRQPCRSSPCLCQVRVREAVCQGGLEAQAACLGVLVSFPGHVTGPLGQGASEAPAESSRPEILRQHSSSCGKPPPSIPLQGGPGS